ncbi:hypothetical protein MMC30_002373 [Trapelia coarctata]|nr:hypothetical protein [Trapelia coarctata]
MLLQFILPVVLAHIFLVEAGGNRQIDLIPRHHEEAIPRSLQSPRQDLEHVPRAAAGTTVNWATMPSTCMPGICDTANGTFCITNTAETNGSISSNDCVTYDVGCHPVHGLCTASNGTTYGCLTYTLDCYCDAPLQLACTWSLCTWLDWMYTEDWLQTQCPFIQPVDFTSAPSCVSSCLQARSFSNGCITGGRNCFCFQKSFFGCDEACQPEDRDSIYSWWADKCGVTMDNATTFVNSSIGNPSRTAFAMAASKNKVHWYEVVAFLAASISVVLLIVGWLVDPLMRQRVHKRLNPKRHWD